MESYDNMEDYDEIVNGYGCDDEDILKTKIKMWIWSYRARKTPTTRQRWSIVAKICC
jgi:hypothetical protein